MTFVWIFFILIAIGRFSSCCAADENKVKLLKSTKLSTEIVRPATAQTAKKPTSLVILIGSIRGGERAWHSFYRNVLDVNNADCMLVVGEDHAERFSSLYERCRYVFEVEEINDWGEYIDLVATDGVPVQQSDPRLKWRKPVDNMLGGIVVNGVRLRSAGAIQTYLRWLAGQMVMKYNLRDQYHIFTVCRTDFFYICPYDFTSYDMRYVWVLRDNDYGGINDRHMVLSSATIVNGLSVLIPFLRNGNGEQFYRATRSRNVEALVQFGLQSFGFELKRYLFSGFVVGRPYDRSSSEVIIDSNVDPLFGLHWKYGQDFDIAIESYCPKNFERAQIIRKKMLLVIYEIPLDSPGMKRELQTVDNFLKSFSINLHYFTYDKFGADCVYVMSAEAAADELLRKFFLNRCRYVWQLDPQDRWIESFQRMGNYKSDPSNHIPSASSSRDEKQLWKRYVNALYITKFIRQKMLETGLMDQYEQFIITRKNHFLQNIEWLSKSFELRSYLRWSDFVVYAYTYNKKYRENDPLEVTTISNINFHNSDMSDDINYSNIINDFLMTTQSHIDECLSVVETLMIHLTSFHANSSSNSLPTITGAIMHNLARQKILNDMIHFLPPETMLKI